MNTTVHWLPVLSVAFEWVTVEDGAVCGGSLARGELRYFSDATPMFLGTIKRHELITITKIDITS